MTIRILAISLVLAGGDPDRERPLQEGNPVGVGRRRRAGCRAVRGIGDRPVQGARGDEHDGDARGGPWNRSGAVHSR